MADTWTLSTLKTHFDALRLADKEAVATALAAAEKAVTAALTASEKAILKAETSADKRAEASNEIRQAMIDQQKNFASIDTIEAAKQRIDKLETALLTSGAKSAGFGQLGTMLVVAIGVGGTLFGIFSALTN